MWRRAALLPALLLVVACSSNPGAHVSAPAPEAVATTASTDATDAGGPEALFTPFEGGAAGGWTPYQVIGTHLQVPCSYGKCFQPGLIVKGVVVSRSPATSGAQTLFLTTFVYKEDKVFGGWIEEIQDTQTATIPAGVPAAVFADRQWLPNTGGAKRVSFSAVWGDEQGQSLGWRIVVMNERADYVCQTTYTWACGVYDGYVSVTEPS